MALAELYTFILSTYLFVLTLHIRYNNPANSTNIKLGGHFGHLCKSCNITRREPSHNCYYENLWKFWWNVTPIATITSQASLALHHQSKALQFIEVC